MLVLLDDPGTRLAGVVVCVREAARALAGGALPAAADAALAAAVAALLAPGSAALRCYVDRLADALRGRVALRALALLPLRGGDAAPAAAAAALPWAWAAALAPRPTAVAAAVPAGGDARLAAAADVLARVVVHAAAVHERVLRGVLRGERAGAGE